MKLDVLQVGRALAALTVIAGHAADQSLDRIEPFPEPLRTFLANGYLGVDFFFVLSGFIIYHTTVGQPATAETVRRYAWARLTRIYLPYWPIGLAMVAVFTLLPGLVSGETEWSWVASLTLLPAHEGPALVVAWTLQHEIVFYLIFGLGLALGRPLTVLMAWMAVILLSRLVLPWTDGTQTAWYQVLVAPINLEFGMGVAAAMWFRSRRAIPPAVLVLGLVVPFGLWLLLGSERSLSFLVGPSIAMAVAALTLRERAGGLRLPRVLVFLGDASYALYLIHNPLLSVVSRLPLGSWLEMLIWGMAVSVAAGVLYHLLVERPLLRRVVRRAPSRRAQPQPL
jgi:exopolysaccharide production protein ExoZ